MMINMEYFIRWANNGVPGTKVKYANFRPCERPSMAKVVTRLTELGKITTTSKVIRKGKSVLWEAVATKL